MQPFFESNVDGHGATVVGLHHPYLLFALFRFRAFFTLFAKKKSMSYPFYLPEAFPVHQHCILTCSNT